MRAPDDQPVMSCHPHNKPTPSKYVNGVVTNTHGLKQDVPEGHQGLVRRLL